MDEDGVRVIKNVRLISIEFVEKPIHPSWTWTVQETDNKNDEGGSK